MVTYSCRCGTSKAIPKPKSPLSGHRPGGGRDRESCAGPPSGTHRTQHPGGAGQLPGTVSIARSGGQSRVEQGVGCGRTPVCVDTRVGACAGPSMSRAHVCVYLRVRVHVQSQPRAGHTCACVRGFMAWAPIYMGIRVHVWVCIPMHVHPCTCASVCTSMLMCGHPCAGISTCIRVRVRPCMWASVFLGTHVHGNPCVWASLCMSTRVQGCPCVWASVCGGICVHVHPRVWASVSMGIHGKEHPFSCASLCRGTRVHVRGHWCTCVRTCMCVCVGTRVRGHGLRCTGVSVCTCASVHGAPTCVGTFVHPRPGGARRGSVAGGEWPGVRAGSGRCQRCQGEYFWSAVLFPIM
ncbi:PREDICTED: uncharacterized protein LOC108504959 [Lepidothrix coronata]|uniref:Uncharacterized protein LOC108504959 n=1 Tax=Lepidothrix coronata TaxID=321398 RepID=A0A6J0IH97_9PASS|nr:PREDICTED: uncharacterized protein LOC108504959 [Lepidothrix coronata]